MQWNTTVLCVYCVSKWDTCKDIYAENVITTPGCMLPLRNFTKSNLKIRIQRAGNFWLYVQPYLMLWNFPKSETIFKVSFAKYCMPIAKLSFIKYIFLFGNDLTSYFAGSCVNHISQHPFQRSAINSYFTRLRIYAQNVVCASGCPHCRLLL
jgi:hypothetical protein